MTELRIKKLDPRAKVPHYESEHASGLDLAALEPLTIPPGQWGRVHTGLAMEIPAGFEGQVRPRSGLALKKGLTVLNAPGTIDADYRGEIMVALINHSSQAVSIEAGERIAQLVICPVTQVRVDVVQELSETARGPGGFGSTGS